MPSASSSDSVRLLSLGRAELHDRARRPRTRRDESDVQPTRTSTQTRERQLRGVRDVHCHGVLPRSSEFIPDRALAWPARARLGCSASYGRGRRRHASRQAPTTGPPSSDCEERAWRHRNPRRCTSRRRRRPWCCGGRRAAWPRWRRVGVGGDGPAGRAGAGVLPVDGGQQQHRAARQRPEGGAVRRRRPATSASSTPTSRSPATTRSSAASTASRSTTCRTRPTRRCAASFVCPGGQGDVSVFGNLLFMSVEETRGRIDCGTQGAPGTSQPRALPRGAHLRHQRPEQPGAAARCADLPRLAHAHDRHRPGRRRRTSTSTTPGTAGVRSAAELAGCENASSDNPDPVTTGNPTQWRIDVIKVPLATPQTAAIVSQPRIFTDPDDRCVQRPAEHPDRHAAPVRHRLLAGAEHQHLPRHHGLPGVRPRGRRLPGQRHPARHLRPGEPGAARRGVRPELLVLALGHAEQRRHEGDLHRRVGRRHVARAAGSTDQLEWGADAHLRHRRRPDGVRAATTRCPRCRRPRRTASRTTPRWSRCRGATSWCRPGTRAGCR